MVLLIQLLKYFMFQNMRVSIQKKEPISGKLFIGTPRFKQIKTEKLLLNFITLMYRPHSGLLPKGLDGMENWEELKQRMLCKVQ